MSNVIPFKRPSLKERHKGNTLCRNNHHKWLVVKENQFDSQQGKLVTCYRCERCGKRKNKAL
ncbi:hypothetical protein EDC56_2433 [Sinobacterium caligoides]|uniref:Uncharacterized protein n=1 Tax=Sinobacterium caligoides TaxID=933926 RepID=A0A3N2DQ70_9GAMM|nr:hypothetical protein [Sinobacterium caligoides]ROS01984.1 hypothetical protein EDC56_2433 [Sinobacterium caligoides]